MPTNIKNNAVQQEKIEEIVQNQNSLKFYEILNGPEFRSVLSDHLFPFRTRTYDPIKTLSMFVCQSLTHVSSCQAIVNESCISGLLEGNKISSATGAYCQARKKLPLELFTNTARFVAQQVEHRAPNHWKWMGRSVYVADGTTVSMPDTPENQLMYPQHGGQEEGAGFPLCRLVVLTCLATAVVMNAAIAPFKGKGTGESTLLRSMLTNLTRGDVLLGDAIYPSYFILSTLLSLGVDGLFEKMGNLQVDFTRGTQLGNNDVLQVLLKPARPGWMSKEQYQTYPDSIEVRFVKSKNKVLVTTMTDSKKVTKEALCVLYGQRWNVELDIRDIKSTLGMDQLSCRSPEMIEKEIWSYFLGYNLIRLMMAQSGELASVEPSKLSFKHALQLYLIWLHQTTTKPEGEELHRLFSLISQKRVGKRPNRVEPRKVKRRGKPFEKLKGPRNVERKKLSA